MVWLTTSSQYFKKARVANFVFVTPLHCIVASQWDGNAAFTVHAICCIGHAFRAAMKLAVRCCQGRAKGGGERAAVPGIQRGHPKSKITKSTFQSNLVTRGLLLLATNTCCIGCHGKLPEWQCPIWRARGHGHLPPVDAFWGRQSEVWKLCNNYDMSHVSQC